MQTEKISRNAFSKIIELYLNEFHRAVHFDIFLDSLCNEAGVADDTNIRGLIEIVNTFFDELFPGRRQVIDEWIDAALDFSNDKPPSITLDKPNFPGQTITITNTNDLYDFLVGGDCNDQQG